MLGLVKSITKQITGLIIRLTLWVQKCTGESRARIASKGSSDKKEID